MYYIRNVIQICITLSKWRNMAKLELEILFFLLALFGGDGLARFIKWILKIRLESEQNSERANSMKLSIAIGYLERSLIFLLVLNGHPESIGWIFAAKSIARFKELENRRFTEYYLIGTLASIFWALFCGVAAQWFIKYIM